LSSKKSSAGKTYPNPMKSTIKQPMPAKGSLKNTPAQHKQLFQAETFAKPQRQPA